MKNSLILVLLITLWQCTPAKQEAVEVTLPYYSQADFTPEWYDTDDEALTRLHTIKPFAFVNQNGDTVTEQTFKGKIYVANFFFTICPTVCPRMTKNLDKIQDEFANDSTVLLLSHSVMPWVDSVSVLKDYAEEKGIVSDKWHLVTGEKSKIYDMGRKAYFADEGFGKTVTDESDFLHTENIFLIDPNLHIRGIYNGTLPLEMARISEDIARLKKEMRM